MSVFVVNHLQYLDENNTVSNSPSATVHTYLFNTFEKAEKYSYILKSRIILKFYNELDYNSKRLFYKKHKEFDNDYFAFLLRNKDNEFIWYQENNAFSTIIINIMFNIANIGKFLPAVNLITIN